MTQSAIASVSPLLVAIAPSPTAPASTPRRFQFNARKAARGVMTRNSSIANAPADATHSVGKMPSINTTTTTPRIATPFAVLATWGARFPTSVTIATPSTFSTRDCESAVT